MGEHIGDLTIDGDAIRLTRDLYATGNLRIAAVDDLGAPYATLSVNFPVELLADAGLFGDPDAFYMKDWSENERIASIARVSGLFERAEDIEDIHSGFITARAYRVKAKSASRA